MGDAKLPWQRTWWGAMLIVVFTGVLIFLVAVGFYLFNSKRPHPLATVKDVKLGGRQYQAADNSHFWLGSANPKITIVEFADFACPYSEKSFSTIREISVKYKNDVKYIWRDYPVVTDYSKLLALGARCAGEQGLFWPMHDKLFENQGVNTAEQLAALANRIGADQGRFADCLNKQKYLPEIEKDLSAGQTLGNVGTPTWFINGYKIDGDIPRDIFTNLIEQLKK